MLALTLNTNADGQNGQTFVERIAAAELTLPSGAITQVRVRFEAGTTEQLTITNAYVEHRAAAGDAYDFAATPVQLLFSGSGSVTIPSGTSQWSDWAAFGSDIAELRHAVKQLERTDWIEIVNENGVERYRPLARP